MTSENTGSTDIGSSSAGSAKAGTPAGAGRDSAAPAKPVKETEVERARAELVAALTELEDKVNVPKKVRRMREQEPRKFFAAVGTAGTVAAGLLTLGVLSLIRRR
ncbi:MAG TPA: hypothetical protein VGC45_02515 [Gryllotalpicola sp.]